MSEPMSSPITDTATPTPQLPGNDEASQAGADIPAGESIAGQETAAVSLLPAGILPAEGWLGIGAVTGLLLGLGAAALLGKLRGRKKGAASSRAENTSSASAPRVEKLHQQGARSGQQDSFSVSPEDLLPTHGLLCAVADGMGGLSDGDRVSQTAVSAVMNCFYTEGGSQGDPQELLLTLLSRANTAVNQLLGPDGANLSGSTLVLGLVRDSRFYWLSVGDSRVYLYRGGALLQLNREHVYRQELYLQAVNEGSPVPQAGQRQNSGGLTSFLGMGQLKYVDVPAQPIDVLPGDMFLLMSDGVYNALPGSELPGLLAAAPEDAAQAIGEAVAAKDYRNQDNYTAVVIRT